MICPVEIASDMSALQAVRVGDHGGIIVSYTQAAVERSNEGTGSDITGHGEGRSRGGRRPRS